MEPFSQDVFTMTAPCLPCCPEGVDCACYYQTGTGDGGILGPVIIPGTPADAQTFADAYVRECVAVDASNFFFPSFVPASFAADISTPNEVQMTQVTDTTSAAGSGSVFRAMVVVDAGTLTMAWNISGNPPVGGSTIYLVIADCTGSTLISFTNSTPSGSPPWTGTLTKSGLPAGEYMVEVFIAWGSTIIGPSAPVTSVITISNDSTLFAVPVFVEWFDQDILDAVLASLGMTLEEFTAYVESLGFTLEEAYVLVGAAGFVEVCPMFELPIARSNGDDAAAAYADLATAEAALAATTIGGGDDGVVVDCTGYIAGYNGPSTFTASASTAAQAFEMIATLEMAFSVALRVLLYLKAGSTLDVTGAASSTNGLSGGFDVTIRDPVSGDITTIDSDAPMPGFRSFSGSFTAPTTGKYLFTIQVTVVSPTPVPVVGLEVAMNSDLTCDDDFLALPVQAFYDVGLVCPNRIDCS